LVRNIDFSSWQSVILTLVGLIVVSLITIGIRLIMMMTVQHRRERMNRQINERLKILIAAYKTLGGSFTGTLTVDPTHLRDLRTTRTPMAADGILIEDVAVGSERRRRIRDAVEAALSDVILLGTDEHVRLAARAIEELVAGRQVHTHELVASLRDFIRRALDIEPMPSDLVLPRQGPARPASSGSKSKGGDADESKSKGGGGGMSPGDGLDHPLDGHPSDH
jgi:hypothetical protein